MRILLIILTVIGIMLLLILALAAVCLFYPVSYRMKGENEEELSLFGRFWWLFGLLWFEFDVRDFQPQMRFGVFWFKWSFGGRDTEEKEAYPADVKDTAPQADRADKRTQTASLEDKSGEEAAETVQKERPCAEKKDTDEGGRKRKRKLRAGEGRKQKRRFLRGKQKKAFQKKKSGSGSIWKELSDENNHMVAKRFWQEATYIFTHLKPKYAKGAVYFATGDPALTGQLTGALSLLPVMYQFDACACPDFVSDNPYIRGMIVCGGKMSLYHAVLCLIRIIRDENAMKLIQKFR